jgi:hypothetical protein
VPLIVIAAAATEASASLLGASQHVRGGDTRSLGVAAGLAAACITGVALQLVAWHLGATGIEGKVARIKLAEEQAAERQRAESQAAQERQSEAERAARERQAEAERDSRERDAQAERAFRERQAEAERQQRVQLERRQQQLEFERKQQQERRAEQDRREREQAEARQRREAAERERQQADAEKKAKEAAQRAKEERERLLAEEPERKKQLESLGKPYYPRPLTAHAGRTADAWAQGSLQVRAKADPEALDALMALKAEGMPFLLDILERQKRAEGVEVVLAHINSEYIHTNDLARLIPFLLNSQKNVRTRMVVLQYLEKTGRAKPLAKRINLCVKDMFVYEQARELFRKIEEQEEKPSQGN